MNVDQWSKLELRVKGYGVQHHFQQYFNYIMVVSFIDGGYQSTWRKPPTCRKSLTKWCLWHLLSKFFFNLTLESWCWVYTSTIHPIFVIYHLHNSDLIPKLYIFRFFFRRIILFMHGSMEIVCMYILWVLQCYNSLFF